jgi:hypothetical protein
MKASLLFLMPKFKTLTFILILACCAFPSVSQTDTLHIYYQGLQTKTLDSNETKIANWAKTLKGKRVDVTVLAYYEKMDYKKYAQERADEMFLSLNRKARDIITIKSIGPKKGEKYQRSTLDIVYKISGSEDKIVATEKKESAKNSKEEGVTKEKVAVEKKESVKQDAKEEEKVVEKKEKPAKASKVKEEKTDNNYLYDTTYVNGVMKIKKIKIKKTN